LGSGTGFEGIAFLWAHIYNPFITGANATSVPGPFPETHTTYNNPYRSEYIFSNDEHLVTGGNSMMDPEERWYFSTGAYNPLWNLAAGAILPWRLASHYQVFYDPSAEGNNNLVPWFCLPAFNGSYINNSFNDDRWNEDNYTSSSQPGRAANELQINVISQKRIESPGAIAAGVDPADPTTFVEQYPDFFFIQGNWNTNHNHWGDRILGEYINPTAGNASYPYAWLCSRVEYAVQPPQYTAPLSNLPYPLYPDDLYEIIVEWKDALGQSGSLSSTATFYCKMTNHPIF
jgi:hypothetical protein